MSIDDTWNYIHSNQPIEKSKVASMVGFNELLESREIKEVILNGGIMIIVVYQYKDTQ
jgi:hypothetical protein